MLSSEEFECGCCYELLLNPTTLTCGHSFCRYCLAKWFKTSNKTECPECRQTWIGFPQVNVRLRRIVEKSFPQKLKVRVKSQKNTPDYDTVLKYFEEHGKKSAVENETISEEQVKLWVGAVLVVLAVVVVILLLLGGLYWIFIAESQPSEVIYSKPVQKWSIKEVANWVQVLSDQLGRDYSEHFEKAGINGELLLSLNDEDLLSPPLDIFTALHRKVILAEITKLAAAGFKQANDLWEYKNANRISAVFMEFMLQDFPRLTILYHRFLYYDSVWLPFMRTVTTSSHCAQENVENLDEDHDDSAKSKCPTSQIEMTSRDKLWLYTKIFLFPYYLISQFAWQYIDIHFFTIWVIISHCVMLTFRELLQIKKDSISLRKLVNSIIDSTLSFIVSCVLYWIAVIFIPGVILDFIFYVKLYYGALDTAGSIRNGRLQTNAIAKVLGVVFGVMEKVLQFIRALFNGGGRHV